MADVWHFQLCWEPANDRMKRWRDSVFKSLPCNAVFWFKSPMRQSLCICMQVCIIMCIVNSHTYTHDLPLNLLHYNTEFNIAWSGIPTPNLVQLWSPWTTSLIIKQLQYKAEFVGPPNTVLSEGLGTLHLIY